MMTTWTADELFTLATTPELEVAVRRPDGSLARTRTIWVVRVGDDLYVRSYRGTTGEWYRSTQRTHHGRVRAHGTEHDVIFDNVAGHDAPDVDEATIDEAYRDKYGRSAYVDAMVSDAAGATTMRLRPC